MQSVYPQRKQIGEDQREIALAVYSIERWRETWMDALRGAGMHPCMGGKRLSDAS